MARAYAVGTAIPQSASTARPAAGKLPGLSGSITTLVNGVVIPAGTLLPPGTTSYDINYFVTVQWPDAQGTLYTTRIPIQLQNISTGASNAEIVQAVQAERQALRLLAQQLIGPLVTTP